MHRFRIFVSYASEDRPLAEKLVEVLDELKTDAKCDLDIGPCTPFTDAIKGLISSAHVFMPLVTDNSQKRPWVHQETGYAMALNIPVLPIAVNTLPAEMISQLQAVSINEDGSDLAQKVSQINFDQLVIPPPSRPHFTTEIADWPETRTELMAKYTHLILEMGKCGLLRQRGALSSFCIPDKHLDHPIWMQREGKCPRSRYYLSLLREERLALEKIVRECGCKLMIDPTIDFSIIGPTVMEARLLTLVEFLNSISDDKVEIVITSRGNEGNLTIAGDWFVAESLTPRAGEGYRQTIFSWHAPTVLRWVRRFDQEFKELYEQSNLQPKSSRRKAIEYINEIITRLPK